MHTRLDTHKHRKGRSATKTYLSRSRTPCPPMSSSQAAQTNKSIQESPCIEGRRPARVQPITDNLSTGQWDNLITTAVSPPHRQTQGSDIPRCWHPTAAKEAHTNRPSRTFTAHPFQDSTPAVSSTISVAPRERHTHRISHGCGTVLHLRLVASRHTDQVLFAATT